MPKYGYIILIAILLFAFTTKIKNSVMFTFKKIPLNPTYDDFIKVILKNEGGLTTDTGGLTNFGLSDLADGKKDEKYKNHDIRTMTISKAKEIYKTDYFNPLASLFVKYPLTALHIFDSAVNNGLGRAKQLIYTSYDVSNISDALKKVASMGDEQSALKFIESRINFYKNLVSSNPSKYGKYEKGWLNRVNNTQFV